MPQMGYARSVCVRTVIAVAKHAVIEFAFAQRLDEFVRRLAKSHSRCRSRNAATFARLPHVAALQKSRRCAFVRSTNHNVQPSPAHVLSRVGSSCAINSAM